MEPGRDAVEFCSEVRARLVGSLVVYCGDRSLGEELAHEAIVRALERWERVRGLDCPEAWVFRVGFNLAKSSRQRRLAEQRANQRLARQATEHASLPDTPTAVAVRAAVEQLTPRQRAVVIARFYAGMDVKTTATLGCAEGTVKALSHKAMARLRATGLIDPDPEEIADAQPR